ncbi:hypothetical protein B566_EDAN013235 [Ephemera danica]|nr:hypothetical protein B566_EDAN013235 [Ephemera danica]
MFVGRILNPFIESFLGSLRPTRNGFLIIFLMKMRIKRKLEEATVNAKELFTSIDASWPGSVHDSRTLKLSTICPIMKNNMVGALLLGDAGYALTPWLMTPYKNPATNAQRRFNTVHIDERVTVERVFGQLKRRFPMLHYTIRLKLVRVPKVIVAACILHNVSKFFNDPDDFDPIDFEVADVPLPPPGAQRNANARVIRAAGEARRNALAARL